MICEARDIAPLSTIRKPEGFPPFEEDSEAAVIAGCLIDDSRIPDAAKILPDESAFFRDHHRIFWRIILDLWADGKPVDGVTFVTEAERLGITMHDSLGIGSSIRNIIDKYPLPWNIVEYALAVRRAANLREVIDAGNEMIREAYRAHDDPETLISAAVARLTTLQSTKLAASTETPEDLLPGVIERILKRRDNARPSGILTPWEVLNANTDGIQSSDFVVVAARPSMGKTAFGLNIVEAAAVDWGVPTLFISLEMSNTLLMERMLSARAEVDAMDLRTGRVEYQEFARIEKARLALKAAPFRMVRRPGRTLPEIIGEIRRAHATRPLGLIVIDYIQLIRSDNQRESETQALTRISGDLKGITSQLEIPIIALSQINRNNEGREDKRPRMSDIRGSGTIEQDADVVVLLHRPDYYDPHDQPGIAEVDLAKNRNGTVTQFRLVFEKQFLRFANFDPNAGVVPQPATEYGPAF